MHVKEPQVIRINLELHTTASLIVSELLWDVTLRNFILLFTMKKMKQLKQEQLWKLYELMLSGVFHSHAELAFES